MNNPRRGGVLLVNLGTPEVPTAPAIRRYLREFLSDRRVVPLPRLLWWPILYGFILPFRARRLVPKYELVWTFDGAPLLSISKRLQQALRTELSQRLQADLPVALAMRYGAPSLADALAELHAAGVQFLVVLPLYPQYSRTTTASVADALEAARVPERFARLEFIQEYYADPGYIAALARSIRAHWEVQGRGEHLLMSFHGIPERCVAQGDPYAMQCEATAKLLAEALQLPPQSWSLAYQSRLGRAPWLKPYTDLEVPRLAQAGVRRLDVIAPGFAADCLETLEEVAMRYAAAFREAGGETLRYVPALNDAPAHVAALAGLIEKRLA